MKQDLTDITLVVDRSGSMESIRDDAQGGINAFIDQQKKLPGQALLSLVQFDDQYDVIHNGNPIGDVPYYELKPRGSTALLDAVGKAINTTGERLAAMPEADRPGLVVFVIVTDGQENSSREFNKSQVRELIERQQKDYSWQFVFLAANSDAFSDARGMGLRGAISGYTGDRSQAAYAAASSNVCRMRSASLQGDDVVNQFTDEEVKTMGGLKS